MLVEILSRVGQNSSDQLFILKSVCKSFLKLSEDPLVFKRLSLDQWRLSPWGNPKLIYLFNLCTVFGNPTTIFRLVLISYFDAKYTELGLDFLKEASNSQLKEAVYVYGLIMFASHQIETKQNGLQLLNETFPPVLELVVAVRIKAFDLLR
ncbi:putative F-box protein At1g67623 [Rutidosis leptorrhynchoides]|uniref:putative F-box protein At1g67623 n=1 Tax=Rutidosis leptorrhynchoides TaxID=125765 RepID=UPI003A9A216A